MGAKTPAKEKEAPQSPAKSKAKDVPESPAKKAKPEDPEKAAERVAKAAAAQLKAQEQELSAARRKELTAMAVGDLKQLVESKGLEAAKKEDMVEAIVKLEAKGRE